MPQDISLTLNSNENRNTDPIASIDLAPLCAFVDGVKRRHAIAMFRSGTVRAADVGAYDGECL